MKKQLSILCLILGIHPGISAQEPNGVRSIPITHDSLLRSINGVRKDLEALRRLRVSGSVQAQYQIADSAGQQSYDGGNFAQNVDRRFMVRRGRVKFTYNNKNSEYVLQLNCTERGINVADAYIKLGIPKTKWLFIQAGLFNRPFGYEIQQSSSDRETPERGRFIQVLLQNERDMGAALILEAPKNTDLAGLKLVAGMFNGPGIPSNGDYNNPTKPFVND